MIITRKQVKQRAYFLCFMLLVFLSVSAQGQPGLPATARDFSTGLVVPTENYYSVHNQLPAITHSGADEEIRFYVFGNRRMPIDRIMIVQFTGKDRKYSSSVYNMYNRSYRNTQSDVQAYKDSLYFKMPGTEPDSGLNLPQILNELHDLDIYHIPDQQYYLDSLRSSGAGIKSPCIYIDDCNEQFNLVEVKMGSSIRNFRVSSLNYENNAGYPLFKAWSNLNKLFTRISQKSISVNK